MTWHVSQMGQARMLSWGLMAVMAMAMLLGWQWGKAEIPPCWNVKEKKSCKTDTMLNFRCDGTHNCRSRYETCFPQPTICPPDGLAYPYVQTVKLYDLGTCIETGFYFDSCVKCGDINSPNAQNCVFLCAVEQTFRARDPFTGQCTEPCSQQTFHYGAVGECAKN